MNTNVLTDNLDILNALLNGATIITFVAYFWFQNQKGNIITRRENKVILGLKDEIIFELRAANKAKDEVIAKQTSQIDLALENANTFAQFIAAAKAKAGVGDETV